MRNIDVNAPTRGSSAPPLTARVICEALVASLGSSLARRGVGVVAGDDADGADLAALIEALSEAGARSRLWAPPSIARPSADARWIEAVSLFDAAHRVDALVLLGGSTPLDASTVERLSQLMRHPLVIDGRRSAPLDAPAWRHARGLLLWRPGDGPVGPGRAAPSGDPPWQRVGGVPVRGVPPGLALPPRRGAGNDYRWLAPPADRASAVADLVWLGAGPAPLASELAHARRWLRASARVVVASVDDPADFAERRHPFAHANGRFVVASPALLARVGPLDPERPDAVAGAIEWVYRAVQNGAYVVPLTTPGAPPTLGPAARRFLEARCPLGFRADDGRRHRVPKVTVYIPAYNAAATLGEAIDSALAQDFADLEVCVVDDGSTDETPAVLARYADDPRVRSRRQPNRGISAASNAAIMLGRGPYIAQLDADDTLAPHAVRTLVDRLDASGAALVYASHDVIDAAGRRVKVGWEWPAFSRLKLMASNIVHHFRMWRRRDWARVGGFDAGLSSAEDYDFALRIDEIGPIEHITAPLYRYRWHGDNISIVRAAAMTRNHLTVMRRALSRRGLADRWDVLPARQVGRREGSYHRRDETMESTTRVTLMQAVVDRARALIPEPPGDAALLEIAESVCAARYVLDGWWAHPDVGRHLEASRAPLVPRLVAAQVEADRGDHVAALAHAQAALSLRPVELFAQRLAETCKVALGEPAWTEEDEADLRTRFCSAPFERLETRPDGAVKFCCNSWMNVAMGHIDDDPDTIWNSPVAQEVRASILEGRYTYCSRTRCPRILNKTLPRRSEVTDAFSAEILAERPTTLTSRPRDIKLNHDRSCNLSCPSCRRSVYTADGAEFARLTRVADEVILPLLADARIVEITGSGDAFASRHFRYILHGLNPTDHPHLKVDLFTNGLMFTEATWNQLELSGMCRRAVISTDATEEQTYRQLRRGGKLSKLVGNFPFISRLRKAGELERVVLVFVIQRANYRQIPDMIRLTKRFDFDETFLKVLDRWGQTELEYADKNVADPNHPRHGALLEVLRDPLLDDPVVNIGTLKPAYDRARRSPTPGPEAEA